MKHQLWNIRNENSLDNAHLELYLLDDSPEIDFHKRPCIIVCPGGSYRFTSDREAEIIALQFAAMGYHAAVLRYSVGQEIAFPTALRELATSVALVREHAEEWGVQKNAIVVCGFSAGGHLACSLGVFWHEKWLSKSVNRDPGEIRPNAMILGYPVITSGEFSHEGSIRNLLKETYESKKGEVSLELYVNENVPPAFIWGTYEDTLVPVQNSLLLVRALVEKNIPVEYHMFEKGGHGLALSCRKTKNANASLEEPAAAEWIHLVHLWMEEKIQNGYE